MKSHYIPVLTSQISVLTTYAKDGGPLNCVGSINGKYISIKSFDNTVSSYYHYLKWDLIALMAILGLNRTFYVLNLERTNKIVMEEFSRNLRRERNLKTVWPNKPAPGQPERTSHVLNGDVALGLRSFLLRQWDHEMEKLF